MPKQVWNSMLQIEEPVGISPSVAFIISKNVSNLSPLSFSFLHTHAYVHDTCTYTHVHTLALQLKMHTKYYTT